MAWEYRIVHLVADTDDEEEYEARLHNSTRYLNELGNEGWELVNFLPHHTSGQRTRSHAVLKRPKA